VERFYDPQAGEVLLDGINIKTLNVKWLRSQLGLVGQEPVLFMGSVADNIRYGKTDATDEEVEEAAKMANAHDFILEKLNDGYDTQVGQGGGKLSGGQKQRVAIARAIIKKPAVLLLDEATSALDNESERVVQAALDEIMAKQKRTTIVIAHRLSTIRGADKIAVVNKGAVVEQGTYDELLSIGDKGLFHLLASRQAATGPRRESTLVASEAPAAAPPSLVANVRAVQVMPTTNEGMKDTKDKKDKKAAAKEPGVIGRIFALQKDSLGYLFLGCVFAAGSGALPLLAFYYMTEVFVVLFSFSVTVIETDVVYYSLLVLAICAGAITCFTLDSLCFAIASSRLTHRMRGGGMTAFMRQDIGFFDLDSNSAGDLTSFLSEKVAMIEFLTGGTMQTMIRMVFCIVTLLVFVFYFAPWQLALALLGALPGMVTVMGVISVVLVGGDEMKKKQGKELTGKLAVAEKHVGGLVGEVVLGIRTVASFNAEHKFYADYCASVDRMRNSAFKKAVATGAAMGVGMGAMMFVFAGMYYYGGYLVSVGQTDFQAMLIPMFMMMGAVITILGATMGFKDGKVAKLAAERFFQATDRVPVIDTASLDGAKPDVESVKGEIEVKDVYFAYPSAPEHNVCNGYSLTVPAGAMVALCGPSGSGKSTIIQLVERFYDPQAGAVLLDGMDIKALNVMWLRSQLGLVGQEPVLFKGSVMANIRYGKKDATDEEVEEAAKMANAHDFICFDLQDKYETDVGMRGGKLSGGQKQRVAIARAIIKKPAVLLLDEATSALDNESERVVQAALDEIMAKQKRTTIVIAHRLSTIRGADKIAVVNKGAVVEQGTHDDLMELGGLYHSLALPQAEDMAA